MKLAPYRRSLPESDGLSATAALDRIADLGRQGCMLQSIEELSPTLDSGELRRLGDTGPTRS
jgi:hypothetical protein